MHTHSLRLLPRLKEDTMESERLSSNTGTGLPQEEEEEEKEERKEREHVQTQHRQVKFRCEMKERKLEQFSFK